MTLKLKRGQQPLKQETHFPSSLKMKKNDYNVANSHSNLKVSITFEDGKKTCHRYFRLQYLAGSLSKFTVDYTQSQKIISALEILVLKHRCKCRMQAYELVFQSKLEQMWHIIVHDDLSILNWRSKLLAAYSCPRGYEILLSMKILFMISFTRGNNWNTTFISAQFVAV